jgi:hypothetical protein
MDGLNVDAHIRNKETIKNGKEILCVTASGSIRAKCRFTSLRYLTYFLIRIITEEYILLLTFSH